MSSKYKILCLTLIITIGFLARDTVRIAGPLDMLPTGLALASSLVLSFVLIFLTENKKTHNHSARTLAAISTVIATLSILFAYLLAWPSYAGKTLQEAISYNMQRGIDNIADFGYLIILACLVFGLVVGSDKNLRTTYSYRSSKNMSAQVPYERYDKKRYKKRYYK